MEVKGFVVYSRQIGERLRQVVLYTDKLGKVGLIVKLRRGDFPLAVDLFSLSHFKLLQKGGEFELQEFKLIRSHFPASREEFFYLSKVARLVFPFQLPPSQKLFSLIDRYFQVKGSFSLAYTMFLLKFSFLEGIFPTLNRCISCGSKDFHVFSLERGGVLCKKCSKRGDYPWSKELTRLSLLLTKKPFESLKDRALPTSFLSRITEVFEKHVNYRLS